MVVGVCVSAVYVVCRVCRVSCVVLDSSCCGLMLLCVCVCGVCKVAADWGRMSLPF